ncbi:replication factor C subunit 1 [Caerostris darwini]|uniref:Replication factor C subunit 1 n=1 Tax=Caerostris darwini TaxID=1538125 RepID=A0AAV4SSJ6_9ARAC|nr:replication factor C subunit 1 [Caerostris darwini]
MDIRKWFSPKPPGNGQNTADSNKKSSKLSKKRPIIESDSDEEPIPKIKEIKKSPKKNIPEKRKEVSVSDFFGTAPIARNVKKDAPKAKKIREENVHDDDDFQATLKQLDKPNKKLNGHKKPNPEKEDKDKNKNEFIKDEKEKIKSKEKTSPKESLLRDEKEKSKSKVKSSPKESKEVKPPASKKKLKAENLSKMEITPKSDKPIHKIVEIKDEKPAVKKPRSSGGNYASYLNREGPKALGSKEIPEGEEDCLAGLTFIITGVLESMERDEVKVLVERHGGKVMTTLSKNTKYIIIGRDAGASKLDKAEKLGTKQLDEDGLLDLIRTLPGKGPPKKSKPVKKENESETVSINKKSNTKMNLEDEFEMDCDDTFLLEATSDSKPKESNEPSRLEKDSSPKVISPKKKIVQGKMKISNLSHPRHLCGLTDISQLI